MENADNSTRCPWCGTDPLYTAYHDHEWGRPERDPRRLFELLILESFQAGLSWITILRKRDAFRDAFHGFDIDRVARLSTILTQWEQDLMAVHDTGVVPATDGYAGKIDSTNWPIPASLAAAPGTSPRC